ncbi:MAG: DUF4838 domain-containing protein [Armatimonadetes bacterium]|nr:DUF4838 domain-containing protein [Armatimonadota bacterium]
MHARILFVALLLALPVIIGGGSAMALPLVTNGQSDYTIALATDAIAPEQTAALELQTFLQQVTGAVLPIKPEAKVPADAPQIVVGPGERFRAAFPDFDLAKLKHDGIAIRTEGNRLYLAGGRPRGTLYAVYTFLEDTVGVRWWGSREDETFVPIKPSLDIPDLSETYVPKLQYREAFYRGAFPSPYAARSKCNGHFAQIPEEFGGHYNILGWCHTFYALIPPDKYFAQHPEWFSLIDGKRTYEGAQLCLTNEEMRQELTRNALEWIRKNPTAGIISIAQNDCWGPCQCPNCQRIVDEEGSQSGPLIRFVNAVAAEIAKEYPDFLVETLAYQYTRQAPKLVKPGPNVIVRLCSIECSFSQPLATGPQNAKFAEDMRQWSAISPQLYVWDYVTDFANYMIPHPNLRVLADNIRFFVDNKAIGLFEQGDAGCSCSDFPELRAWLFAHLMWDPSRDPEQLIAEFLQGYYGPAARPLQEYIDLIHDAVEKSGTYLTCYMPDTSSWMDLDTINRATELFAEAARLVEGDPVLSARVRRARMPLDHTWLQRYKGLKRLAKMSGKPFLGPEDPNAFVEEFIATALAFDVGQYREGASFDGLIPSLRGRFPAPGSPAARPREAEGLPDEDWQDVQQGDFTLANPPTWVNVVDDAKASDGKAACMPANHTQWATQFSIEGDAGSFAGKWHCYVVARCEARADTGIAFQIGLYDNNKRDNVIVMNVPIEQVKDGEYKTFDLGAHELRGGMYIWLAPVNNPDAVTAIYTDRIFLLRERE